jgi:outer membrane protein OmpA-like peptidoglycan-associated protein
LKTARTTLAARTTLYAVVVALGIVGCGLIKVLPGATVQIRVPAAEPSVLVLILDPASPTAVAAARNLLVGTARLGEHLVVLDDRSGAILASSTAPLASAITLDGRPAALPPDPTPFQQARYHRAFNHYKAAIRDAQARLSHHEQLRLAAWAGSVGAAISRPTTTQIEQQARGIPWALSAALADISSLEQIGLGLGSRKVILIFGTEGTPAVPPTNLPGGLQGTTVVAAGFPSNGTEQAAWQASLLRLGASRVALLTPASGGQLPAVVKEGLDGAITDTLSHILFGLGQYKLREAASPALHYLLHLLTVSYPRATASINGYTDDLPAPGSNLELSRRRASAVQAWLIAHGVASSRLQAIGHGDADPIAPNLPAGQPLNRRVVIVINPVIQAPSTKQ